MQQQKLSVFYRILMDILSISLLESVQRAFTKHIQGMHTYSYADRLSLMLKLYSLQRRHDRYTIIYVWKILESIVPNLNIPITCYNLIRRGRLCATSHVGIGHLGTLVYHSFRFRGIRLFNAMPKQIRDYHVLFQVLNII